MLIVWAVSWNLRIQVALSLLIVFSKLSTCNSQPGATSAFTEHFDAWGLPAFDWSSFYLRTGHWLHRNAEVKWIGPPALPTSRLLFRSCCRFSTGLMLQVSWNHFQFVWVSLHSCSWASFPFKMLDPTNVLVSSWGIESLEHLEINLLNTSS